MSFEIVASTVVVLAILVGLIAFLAFLKKKGAQRKRFHGRGH